MTYFVTTHIGASNIPGRDRQPGPLFATVGRSISHYLGPTTASGWHRSSRAISPVGFGLKVISSRWRRGLSSHPRVWLDRNLFLVRHTARLPNLNASSFCSIVGLVLGEVSGIRVPERLCVVARGGVASEQVLWGVVGCCGGVA